MTDTHILHRIYIIFEESDGRLWASGTDMMAPNLESAEVFADRLNEMLGVDRAAWPGLHLRTASSRQMKRLIADPTDLTVTPSSGP